MHKVLIILLLIAVLPLPYSYYMFLRAVVFWGLLWLIFKDWNDLTNANKLGYIVVATLFNPFSLFYFSKLMWIVYDILSAYYLIKVLKQMKIPLYKI